MTHLAPLPPEAFARFRTVSITEYAEDNIASGRWPAEGAEERSRQSYDELLPQGLATPNQHLFEMRDSAGASVGTIWLAVIEQASARHGYIYDVRVEPGHRRQGHARAAFLALEPLARDLGLERIALHVFAHNPGAQALYRSLGYEVTGINMQKKMG
jgi:ribosomal protein S18 acetylase RimI-like enzyme